MHRVLARASVAAFASALATFAAAPVAGAAHPVRHARMSNSIPTFQISVFAQGSQSLYNPDAVAVTSTDVFVDYQNNSDTVRGVPSIIVKYTRGGVMEGQVSLIGRCDGMRMNPYTNQLWALLNNDGLNGKPARQPLLYTIDPTTLTATVHHFPAVQPHGGGYDDLAFAHGQAFISASSPILNKHGINDKPAIDMATLSGSNVIVTPVVWGNTYGFDIPSRSFMRLNITDPDSMTEDAQGDVVLSSEGDAQVIFVRHIGRNDQAVLREVSGTQLDEIAFTSGTMGTFFVADDAMNVVYSIAGTFDVGTVLAEAGQGAPVQGFIGTLDTSSGILTPLLGERDGILDPTTLTFIPAGT